MDRYSDLVQVVRPVEVAGIASDPDDDVVIGTALAARAELIVTGDKALICVGEHCGVRIVGVGQALEIVNQPG